MDEYLITRQGIVAPIFDITRFDVETSPVPRTSHVSVSQCAILQYSTVMRAFGTNRVQLPFLFYQQYLFAFLPERYHFHFIFLDILLLAHHAFDILLCAFS